MVVKDEKVVGKTTETSVTLKKKRIKNMSSCWLEFHKSCRNNSK